LKPRKPLRVDNAASYEIGSLDDHKVIPWLTVNGTDFARTTTYNGETFIVPVDNYSTTLLEHGNIKTTGLIQVSNNISINSLVLGGSGTLQSISSSSRILTIESGGILSYGGIGHLRWNGSITTAGGAPLYIHAHSELRLYSRFAALTGGMDLVKSGPGKLLIYHDYTANSPNTTTHKIGSLYINEGEISIGHLFTSNVSVFSIAGEIFVGDGAGTDILSLAPNRRNQLITPTPNVFPKLTLHGTPHDPRGALYGGDQAILRMGGNTKQHLSELHIKERGTIDWVGGEVGAANILYLDSLTFSGPDAILFMKNWYEYEDRLLVKQYGGFDPAYLQNIHFEGYENFPVIMRKYDWQYWEITPFGTNDVMGFMPEPTTYGAILGTVGLGIWTWRRRRKKTSQPSLPKAG